MVHLPQLQSPQPSDEQCKTPHQQSREGDPDSFQYNNILDYILSC